MRDGVRKRQGRESYGVSEGVSERRRERGRMSAEARK